MEHLITIANLLYVGAYFVREVLWLRMLALAGSCCLALYFASRPDPLMNVVCWNLFFAALNAFWIARLLAQRRAALAASAK
jgi:hypothetical protein